MNLIGNRFFYGKYVKSISLNTVIGFIFIISLSIKLFNELKIICIYAESNLNLFGFSEFLISFEGGFVRRGLLGQILFFLSKNLEINPFYTIIFICVIAYLIVVLFFWRKFKQKNYCWWILLSSVFLGFTAAFIRKDYLLYCIFIYTIIILKQKKTRLNYIFVIFLTLIGLFIHEAYVFWGIPIITLLLFKIYPQKWLPIISSIIFVGITAILFLNNGNVIIAEQIRDSWNDIFGNQVLIQTSSNSIGALGWDTKETIINHFKANFPLENFGYMIFLIRFWGYFIVYYVFTNSIFVILNDNRMIIVKSEQLALSTLFIFASLCLLPMFTFLSCDWSRLYQYILIVSFSVFLLFPPYFILNCFPKKLIYYIRCLNISIQKILVPTKPLLIILLLTINISPVGFDMIDAFLRSPLGTIFYSISLFLTNIIH